MKMQKRIASAVLLPIVLAIAFNALAGPVQAKNEMEVYMWGNLVGLDEVREIPTGTWALITWGWACLTWDQVDDFLDSIDYTWTIDGEPILEYEIEYLDLEYVKVVWFACNWHPTHPGEYGAELMVTFTKDHFDGWDTYTAGTVILGPRTILVTPRELYPMDPPEEPA